MGERVRAMIVSGVVLAASTIAGCDSTGDPTLCGGDFRCSGGPGWLCRTGQADGEIELMYGYTTQELTQRVIGQWSGRYPGGRMPAFDVSVTVAIADDAQVLYGFPMPVEEGEELSEDAYEDCASVAIAADVAIEHEDVQGVSFDTEANVIAVRGFELADEFVESRAASRAPSGVPGFEVQNTTDEPYQEGDDDEVEFLLGPDETLWILERQPPYRASGQRVE